MKTTGMRHQLEALDKSNGKRNFAYFMEQGLGKTWTTLADAERYYNVGKVECLVVIAPNGVHTNWVKRECPEHLSADYIAYAWKGTQKLKTKKGKAEWERMFADHYPKGEVPLRVFAFSIDSVMTKEGFKCILEVLNKYQCMMVMDEATRIKNPSAKRSKLTCELATYALCRRILTGTPMPRAPEDLFMQFNFLKPGLLGTKSFRAFKSEFTVLLEEGDPEMQAILKKLAGKCFGIPQVAKKDDRGQPMFKNLDKLKRLMEPHVFRATKEEYLTDLPPKMYKFIFFEMTSKQRDIYDELKNELTYLMEYKGQEENVAFELIASRTKMKQVTSGFIKVMDELVLMPPEDNPRLSAFKDYIKGVLEDDPGRKFIVWAMFKEEMKQIVDFLESEGVVCGVYNGETSRERRDEIIDGFQKGNVADGGIQAFVGHAAAAGIGITLTAADLAIYYSCSYDNELRKQSEDRNHRIGTKSSVLYVDFIAEDSIDEDIQLNLSRKQKTADYVLDNKPI